jgi:trimeric autotransporter adhesin
MATRYWLGKALGVAQVDTVEVTAYHADTTYTLTVNGVAVVTQVGDTNVTVTAAAMATKWNASLHPYCIGITASNASGVITLTADQLGEPNTVTSSKSGTGTIGSVTSVTAATGPRWWNNAANWSGDTVPVSTDIVIIDNSTIDILFGIDQSGMSGQFANVTVGRGYRGVIGLNAHAFFVNGSDNASATEYRETYLKIKCNGFIEIGKDTGTGTEQMSRRIKIHSGATEVDFIVYNTEAIDNSVDVPKPCVQLNMTHATSTLEVRGGEVGVAVAIEGETATLGTITNTGGRIITGSGLTLTTYVQTGASSEGSQLHLAATLTTLTNNGGDTTTSGSFAVTTMNTAAGQIISNSTGTITAANSTGGHLDFSKSRAARTVSAAKVDAPGSISFDPAYLTLSAKVTSNNPVRYTATAA